MASEGKVRPLLLQFGALCLLMVCLCGHVAEIFDIWGHTLQTGNDIEYTLVILALVAGAGIGLVHVGAIVMRAVSRTHAFYLHSLLPPAAHRLRLRPLAFRHHNPSESDSLAVDTGLARLIHSFCSIEGGHVFIGKKTSGKVVTRGCSGRCNCFFLRYTNLQSCGA